MFFNKHCAVRTAATVRCSEKDFIPHLVRMRCLYIVSGGDSDAQTLQLRAALNLWPQCQTVMERFAPEGCL